MIVALSILLCVGCDYRQTVIRDADAGTLQTDASTPDQVASADDSNDRDQGEIGDQLPPDQISKPCESDRFEPNDLPATASQLPSGTVSGLSVCGADEDWFAALFARGERVDVEALYASAGGKLSLTIVDGVGTVLAVGAPTQRGRRLSWIASEPGLYYLRVAASVQASLSYQLEVSRSPANCDADPFEPNDGPLQATPIASVIGVTITLCGHDSDWFSIPVVAGSALTVRATTLIEQGNLDLFIYRKNGEALQLLGAAETSFPVEQLTLLEITANEMLLLEVRGDGQNLNSYTLALESAPSGTLRSGAVAGLVRYRDQPLTTEGFAEDRWLPARRVEVELVRTFDGAVVASALTDLTGRYRMVFSHSGPSGLTLRALARTQMSGVSIVVQNSPPSAETYAVESPDPVDEKGQTELTIDLDIDVNPVGGAFNIIDVTVDAFVKLGPLLTAPKRSALTYYWRPGFANFCVTCYLEGQIYISGVESDPDHYDDPVILHELGHFFEEAFARRDTPGGFHDLSPVTPPLAWSEGFAHYFQALVRDEANYIDSVADALVVQSFAEIKDPRTLGTVDGTLEGYLSEAVVFLSLWEIFTARRGAGEILAIGETLAPSLYYLGAATFGDRGAGGADFVDYLDGWFCLGLGQKSLIEQIVVTGRQFPYDFGGLDSCFPE